MHILWEQYNSSKYGVHWDWRVFTHHLHWNHVKTISNAFVNNLGNLFCTRTTQIHPYTIKDKVEILNSDRTAHVTPVAARYFWVGSYKLRDTIIGE